MVAVKKLSLGHFKKLRNCEDKNLLSIIETYRFEGQFFVITDYTDTTLQHIISISLPLQEPHVTATCRQVFEGMWYLHKFGIAHKKLDSSKVLFLSDGITPATDEELVLSDPDRWSSEASEFLEVASWATLKEVQDVRAP
ncbi:hypothetical protein F5884DRAFT_838635 [Xylogone sp. PMI_703]|nr:hypothetical protein F5884DRAFT_838635 [Xylogone sp. PMI_703]